VEKARTLKKADARPLAGTQDICKHILHKEPASNLPHAAELYEEVFENGAESFRASGLAASIGRRQS